MPSSHCSYTTDADQLRVELAQPHLAEAAAQTPGLLLRTLQMARRNKYVYNFFPWAISYPCRRGESERVMTLEVEQSPEIYLCRFETCE